ncbi:MAG: HDOD domain-containing protein [Halospina sp.]
MERLIQSLLSFLAGNGSKGKSRSDTVRRERSEGAQATDVDTVGEVARLHAWLVGRSADPDSGFTVPEEAMIAELRLRIRDRRLSRIPRQPRVLPKLIRALGDERQTHRDIAVIIEDEPALTDELLRVVNLSTANTGQWPIESVEQAVLLVGFEGVRRAVSEAVMRPVMQAASRAEAGFARNVWQWGLLCANACDRLAHQEPGGGPDLFMLGLIPGLAYLTLYRELESIADLQSGDHAVSPGLLVSVLEEQRGAMLERLVSAWELPASYRDELRELHDSPLGLQASTLSRGMVLGTHETLRQAGCRTLLQKELVAVTGLDHRRLERVLTDLRPA